MSGLPTVWIALGSCQGTAFLDEQLASLRAQTHADWRLLIRDDASTDGSPALLRRFAASEPRAELIEDQRGQLGPAANFGLLLEAACARGAEWVALADQDDVWEPDKLERELACAAAASGAGPLLVHSDLELVDTELRPLHPSFMRYAGLRHPARAALPTLLVQNFVTGCTCLADRALLEVALPVPARAVMHDWWLALCAAATGRLRCAPGTTVRYRQHAHNRIGALSLAATLDPRRRRHSPFSAEAMREYAATLEQARALRERLASLCAGRWGTPRAAASLELVSAYCALFERDRGRLARVRGVLQLGVRRQDPLRQLLLLFKLLAAPAEHLHPG
jgi:rhamnosyltransferase